MTKQEQQVKKALENIGVLVSVNEGNYLGDRSTLWIDFEEPQNMEFADYWSNMFGTDEFNKTMNDLGMYWEWVNSAYASIYKI